MITRVDIKNFKAIESASVELTPIHLLIGPNDSGKTSVLEAIAAICRSVDHDATNSFLGRWQGRELVHSSAEKPEVEIAAEFREEQFDGRYRVNARFPSLGQEVEWLTAEFVGRGERRGLWGDPRFTAPCVLFEPRFQAYKNSA
ncbi:MAG: AAA family ATPase, partial [Planctomycetales bacterium]|nr:AAA family ATPase [Planctomycetales bacterium]